MKSKEILDLFGKLLIAEVYDEYMSFFKSDIDDLRKTERFKNLFANMTFVQKTELENLSFELLSGLLFDFLRIFEENDEFKLIYEAEGERIDLMKISEMLKAEPIIEGGWIARFSKFTDKRDKGG